MTAFKVVYVTTSDFKIRESVALAACTLSDGTPLGKVVEFCIRSLVITEILEVNLEAMVRAEARAAYARTKVPTVVEHAGLVFEGHEHFPGGLTKPMWNALKDRFVAQTHMVGRAAIARAVVGYCDGMSTRTFVGETNGQLVDPPRGSSNFYWDRVFVPDGAAGKTYAEIVEDPSLGLEHKMQHFSQSAKAMRSFVEYRRAHGSVWLWK